MGQRNIRAGVADEGGWWPNFASNEAALDTLALAIKQAGYDEGKVVISLDIAASEFAAEGRYKLALEDRTYGRDEWLALLEEWTRIYPIASIEDPVSEEDVEGMQAFTKSVGQRIQVIGDDYLVTNADRIRQAQKDGACNAALIKPNQAGTLTETKAALDAARNGHWRTVVSARSGETEDVSVAHLAVGWDARQLKVGSFARSERMAKWNEVLRIEEALGQDAHFAGVDALQLSLKPSK
jgi:enolase